MQCIGIELNDVLQVGTTLNVCNSFLHALFLEVEKHKNVFYLKKKNVMLCIDFTYV